MDNFEAFAKRMELLGKGGVTAAFRLLGFDIRRLSRSNAIVRLAGYLQAFDIDLVFDIGANTGQFASALRRAGFAGRIVSFEPLSSAHWKLSTRAARDKLWTVHARCAVGDRDGEATINISGNSYSSSLLPMMDLHAAAAEKSAYIGSETTPVHRFDTIAATYLSTSSRPFLKIDTQGSEWQVLDGAAVTLPGVSGILCELSLVPLYGHQRLWLDIVYRLNSLGFTLWSIDEGFRDPRNQRLLQIDGTFFK